MRRLHPWLITGLVACVAASDPVDETDGREDADRLDGEGELDESLAEALQSALEDASRGIATPGSVAAVRFADGSAWVGTYGVSRSDTGAPVTDDLAFRAGSITKTLIAAVVLQLVDEGELSLEDTADAWYPQIPNAAQVTLRDLLGHTSGLRSYTEIGEFYSALSEDDPDDPGIDTIIGWSADDGPQFAPGAAYSYSNTNYFVLGRILERELDEELDVVLARRVYGPVGLEHTWIDGYGEPSEPTEVSGGHLNGLPDRPLSPDWRWASGGLNADARDLVRWAEALVDGDLVPADLREDMFSPSALSVSAGESYGLGVRVRDLPCGRALGHTGSTMGFQSDMFRTDQGVTIVTHANDFFSEASEIAYALCDVVAAQ